VELMETLGALGRVKAKVPALIASIIGSGINGNCDRHQYTLFSLLFIASIIGSGINGNQ